MTENRRCKVLATVGPASDSYDQLEALVKAGVNGFRFNYSHGSTEDFLPLIEKIRQISSDLDEPVACLADLPGPKLRLGEFGPPLDVEAGDRVRLYPESSPEPERGNDVPVSYPALLEDVEPGEVVFLEDGQIQLEVVEKTDSLLEASVVYGGVIKPRKGVNLPESCLSVPALTQADREQLKQVVRADFDFVALSFVRTPEDLEPVREEIDATESQLDLIAKIETRRALDNLSGIISVSDGVMVARGDLGVEIGQQRVPYYQKEIIRRTNSRGKIVITATQMLESMIEDSSPTRAETSDVANAVLDGSDVVMLSGETAVGNYPVRSVRTMVDIITSTESDFRQELRELSLEVEQASHEVAVSMVNAAARCARDIDASAVVIPTFSGSTARLLSNTYTPCPLIALCVSPRARQKSALYRNVYPGSLAVIEDTDKLIKEVRYVARDLGLGEAGDKVVLLAGLPLAEPGITNLIHVLEI